MKIQPVWTLFLGIMALCEAAHGYPKDHGPFQKGEAPTSVPLTDCALVKKQYVAHDEANRPSVLYFAAPQDPKRARLKMEYFINTGSNWWRITVLDGEGR